MQSAQLWVLFPSNFEAMHAICDCFSGSLLCPLIQKGLLCWVALSRTDAWCHMKQECFLQFGQWLHLCHLNIFAHFCSRTAEHHSYWVYIGSFDDCGCPFPVFIGYSDEHCAGLTRLYSSTHATQNHYRRGEIQRRNLGRQNVAQQNCTTFCHGI